MSDKFFGDGEGGKNRVKNSRQKIEHFQFQKLMEVRSAGAEKFSVSRKVQNKKFCTISPACRCVQFVLQNVAKRMKGTL